MMLRAITVAKVFIVLTYKNKNYLKSRFETLKREYRLPRAVSVVTIATLQLKQKPPLRGFSIHDTRISFRSNPAKAAMLL